MSVFKIPFYGDDAATFFSPFSVNTFIFCIEGIKEMLIMLCNNVFYAKVIYDNG